MEESKSALAMSNPPNVDKPDATYDFTCDNEENGNLGQFDSIENRNSEDKVVEAEINNPEEGGGGGQNANTGKGPESVSFHHCTSNQ